MTFKLHQWPALRIIEASQPLGRSMGPLKTGVLPWRIDSARKSMRKLFMDLADVWNIIYLWQFSYPVHCILIFDGFDSHCTPVVAEYFAKFDILTANLPSHISHMLQTLYVDVAQQDTPIEGLAAPPPLPGYISLDETTYFIMENVPPCCNIPNASSRGSLSLFRGLRRGELG